jgi:hypothetical protein
MANRQRGHVAIELDRVRRLKYDFNAVCELEDALGKPVTQLKQENVGFREMRAMLWAGLLHEEPDLTIQEAGALAGEAESIEYVTEKVVEAFALGLGGEKGNEGKPKAATAKRGSTGDK